MSDQFKPQKYQGVNQSANGGAAASVGAASSEHARMGGGLDGRRDWLGKSLRQLYQETVEDPIPDSFKDLLEKLALGDRQK